MDIYTKVFIPWSERPLIDKYREDESFDEVGYDTQGVYFDRKPIHVSFEVKEESANDESRSN